MNNESKKLAKLLEVKSKVITSSAETELYKKAEQYDVDIRYDFGTEKYYIEIYPDFTKPDNFIKLLKIQKWSGCTIGEAYNLVWSKEQPELFLINELVEDVPCWKDELSGIRIQTQQIKWSY